MQKEQTSMKQIIRRIQNKQTKMIQEQSDMKKEQKIMRKDVSVIKDRQRIDGINIARILEKQNETFSIINKRLNNQLEKSTELKILK